MGIGGDDMGATETAPSSSRKCKREDVEPSLKTMCYTFSVCLSRSAGSAIEAISLALHSRPSVPLCIGSPMFVIVAKRVIVATN